MTVVRTVTSWSKCSSQCWCSASGCKLFCISLWLTFSDYDAPLSEAGDITEKYLKTRELILEKVYKPLGVLSVSLLHSVFVSVSLSQSVSVCLSLFSLWNFGLYKCNLCTRYIYIYIYVICFHQFSVKSLQPIGPRHRNSHWGLIHMIFHFFPELPSLDLKLCS